MEIRSSYLNEVSRNISAIDNESNKAVTSSSNADTGDRLKDQNNFNMTKALIQVMYKRGEINSKTYESTKYL